MTEKAPFNVLDSMYTVTKHLEGSEFNLAGIVKIKPQLSQLREYFKVSEVAILLFCVIYLLSYRNEALGVKLSALTSFLRCDSIRLLQYKDSFVNLYDNRLINVDNEFKMNYSAFIDVVFYPNTYVSQLIIDNNILPEQRLGKRDMTHILFVETVSECLYIYGRQVEKSEFENIIVKLEEIYDNLPLIQNLTKIIFDIESRILFYKICYETLDYQKKPGRLGLQYIVEKVFYFYSDRIRIIKQCKENKHLLILSNLICYSKKTGLFTLSKKGKTIFADEYAILVKNI